ncbi:DUF1048 domain-containing protein [Cellulomonas sp. Sa3CUA2]|uniref:DUF1048 domain-containing protein n=1 Tax=Cellulomonas avistercoris TaxID=2762242 RepID=A0ABR8QHG6_9CELL|nr:DUF1048 domain-containing protein [Cellulomonas avistercoris]MBD7919879.1 DUF1048 domain-containing protein [Cellulomonas avistercoris]
MAARWIEALTGPWEQKKQYRRDVARLHGLPEPYRTAATGMHRYLMSTSGLTDGDALVQMVGDLVDLWDGAAADERPVRAIVGDDPVEFAESFAEAYSGERWIDKARARLVRSMDEAERRELP